MKQRTAIILMASMSFATLSCMFVQSLITTPTSIPTVTLASTLTSTPAPTPTPTDLPPPPIMVSGCTSTDDCPDTVLIKDIFEKNKTLEYNTEYKVVISADKKVRLYFGWCAIDRKTLDENLKNIKYVFTVDGTSHIEEIKKIYYDAQDTTNPSIQMSCYGVGGVISDWQEARSYRVVFGTVFEKPIFDGWDTYPQADMLRIYLITVDSNASTLPVSPADWNGIPIMPDAFGGHESMGDYQFTTKATAAEIKEYYKHELFKVGWKLDQGRMDSIPTDLAFKRAGIFVFFKILPEGMNNVVMIHIVQQ